MQKSFHEDVVRVIRRKLEEEETLSEALRPTALARSYYLKVRSNAFDSHLVSRYLCECCFYHHLFCLMKDVVALRI